MLVVSWRRIISFGVAYNAKSRSLSNVPFDYVPNIRVVLHTRSKVVRKHES